MILNFLRKKKHGDTGLLNLMEDSVEVIDNMELENIYGGCSIDYSPIASISENIIIDKYTTRD